MPPAPQSVIALTSLCVSMVHGFKAWCWLRGGLAAGPPSGRLFPIPIRLPRLSLPLQRSCAGPAGRFGTLSSYWTAGQKVARQDNCRAKLGRGTWILGSTVIKPRLPCARCDLRHKARLVSARLPTPGAAGPSEGIVAFPTTWPTGPDGEVTAGKVSLRRAGGVRQTITWAVPLSLWISRRPPGRPASAGASHLGCPPSQRCGAIRPHQRQQSSNSPSPPPSASSASNRARALATVVGVLVEVPVMLSVVHIIMRSRAGYDRGARRMA